MKDDLEGFQLAIVVKEDFAIRFHLVYHLENDDLLWFFMFPESKFKWTDQEG